MIISAKAKYRDLRSFCEGLDALAPLEWVQVAFRSMDFDPSAVASALATAKLRVNHIHGPRIKKNSDLRATLPKLADLSTRLGAGWILFHLPRSMNLRALQKLFCGELDALCREAGCSILWETDHGRREAERIASLLELLPEHGMCIDTNHCAKSGCDLNELVARYHNQVPVIHASNRSATDPQANGLSLFDDGGMVDFCELLAHLRRLGWDGEWNLEYHRPAGDNPELLLRDKNRVAAIIASCGSDVREHARQQRGSIQDRGLTGSSLRRAGEKAIERILSGDTKTFMERMRQCSDRC